MLLQAVGQELLHPQIRNMGEALGALPRLQAISRLLEMGALTTSYTKVTPEEIQRGNEAPYERLVNYQVTPFGKAIAVHVSLEVLTPEAIPVLEAMRGQSAFPALRE